MANFFGTVNADTIRATNNADLVDGSSGNDTLFGGGALVVTVDGNDTIYGNGGDDVIYGNGGNDLIRGGSIGSDGTVFDRVTGRDTIYGGLGDDSIHGNDNQDSIAGDGGAEGSQDGADLLLGGDGDDTLLGNGGNDTIVGGKDAGNTNSTDDDVIFGGSGNDLIYGSGGLDAVVGQVGNDTLAGGSDSDLFFIGSNSGIDTILDFEDPDTALTSSYIADDYLVIEKNLNGTGINSFEELMAGSSVNNGNLLLNLGGGNSLTLNGITVLDAADVRFSDVQDRVIAYDSIYGGAAGTTGSAIAAEQGNVFIANGGVNELRPFIESRGIDSNNDYYHASQNDLFVFGHASGVSTVHNFTVNDETLGDSGTRTTDKILVLGNINGTLIDTYAELMAASTVVTGITVYDGNGISTIGSGLQFNLGAGNSMTVAGATTLEARHVEFYSEGDYLA